MFLDIYLYHIHTTGVDAKLRSLSLTVKTLRYYRPRPGPAAAAAWPGRGTRTYWCQHADCGRRERSADTGADRPRWHCQIIAKCSARCPRHQQQPAAGSQQCDVVQFGHYPACPSAASHFASVVWVLAILATYLEHSLFRYLKYTKMITYFIYLSDIV